MRSESSIRDFGGLFNRAEAARGQRPRSALALHPRLGLSHQLPSCVLVEGGLGTGVCVRGLNLLKIPLSCGGFVLFRLSLTFFRLKGKRDSAAQTEPKMKVLPHFIHKSSILVTLV